MTYDEAATILKKCYESAPNGEKALSVHLFGIKYAEHIASLSPHEIAHRAGLKSYGVELNKMRNLARFVTMKN